MKKLVIGIVALTASIPFLMAAIEPTVSATAFVATAAMGEGSMSFHGDAGRAWLKFSIEDGESASGTLIFAAEHHHNAQSNAMMFPDIIVRLSNFEKFSFKNKSVKFSGSGTLHGEPVKVMVEAYDNEGSKKEDRFVIKLMDDNNGVLFFADGYLFQGNIQVGGE